MPYIYSTTELKRNLKDIKELANKEPVYITENGNGAYVFISQKQFEKQIEQGIEDALYALRFQEAMNLARADIEQGRVYDSVEKMFAAAKKMNTEMMNYA